jgi:hypothetical protein
MKYPRCKHANPLQAKFCLECAALGMRPLIAQCHLGLGKLSRRTGTREQAQEHLTISTAMDREMGMRFWLEQAEVEMAEFKRQAVATRLLLLTHLIPRAIFA